MRYETFKSEKSREFKRSPISPRALLLLGVSMFTFGVLFILNPLIISDQSSLLRKRKEIYFIRHCEKDKNRKMGLSFNGIVHSACYIDYFKNFPLGTPQLAYSFISQTMRSIDSVIPLSIELQIPLYNFSERRF
jgi:hypothetical protein